MSTVQNGRAAATAGRSASGVLRILLPVIVAACGTGLWEAVVRHYEIPPYVLPAPRQ